MCPWRVLSDLKLWGPPPDGRVDRGAGSWGGARIGKVPRGRLYTPPAMTL